MLDSARDRLVQDAETRRLASLESQVILINLGGKMLLYNCEPQTMQESTFFEMN